VQIVPDAAQQRGQLLGPHAGQEAPGESGQESCQRGQGGAVVAAGAREAARRASNPSKRILYCVYKIVS